MATQELSRDATHHIETVMGYLGFQYATGKRCPNYQTPGDWKGSITLSLENVGLCVTVSEMKWGRAKQIIGNLLTNFNHANHFP